MFCRFCGAENDEGHDYCKKCGKPLLQIKEKEEKAAEKGSVSSAAEETVAVIPSSAAEDLAAKETIKRGYFLYRTSYFLLYLML